MLDTPYIGQIRAALIVLLGSGFLIFTGWLTSSERHGLPGLILWAVCYGLPAAVLCWWLHPYVATLARVIKAITQMARKHALPNWAARLGFGTNRGCR